MTLVIETCCSTLDQSSIKVLSARHTLCARSLWSEVSVGPELVPPAEWESPLGSLPLQSWQPEVRGFANPPPLQAFEINLPSRDLQGGAGCPGPQPPSWGSRVLCRQL